MDYLDPGRGLRAMDKRDLAAKLRELANELEAAADDDGVCVEVSAYDAPGRARQVNVATRADHDRGNKEVWLDDGRAPSRITWHIEIVKARK